MSEIPFDLTANGVILEFGHQNVFFTLFIGLTMMYVMIKTAGRAQMIMVSLLFS